MPAPHPPEFRQRAVALARQGNSPVSKIAQDLGISDSCLRNWMHQADADDNGSGNRLPGGEKKELVSPPHRMLELGNDILKRAAAYFARENVLPK
jgi:transposase